MNGFSPVVKSDENAVPVTARSAPRIPKTFPSPMAHPQSDFASSQSPSSLREPFAHTPYLHELTYPFPIFDSF
jgi:hypothetical protein